MDITVFWTPGNLTVSADEFNVLYREYDPSGLTNWIIANPTPLPNTATFYSITGLNENTIYEYGIAMSCVGVQDLLATTTFVYRKCPDVSFYQGPTVSGYPTLYYSVFYPNSQNVINSKVTSFDTSISSAFPINCPTPTALMVGRTSFQTSDSCSFPFVACGEQTLAFPYPSSSFSATGYFGLDSVGYLAGTCDGLQTDPILFNLIDTFKFNIQTNIGFNNNTVNTEILVVDSSCTTELSAPSFTFTPLVIDYLRVSGSLCWESTTGLVKVTIDDGTGQTNIADYNIEYYTTDPTNAYSLQLVDALGFPVKSNSTLFYVYCPIVYDPNLNVIQLSDDMTFELYLYDPSPLLIYTGTGLDFTGNTPAQMLTSIAAVITANTSYTASYVNNIPGYDCLKINVTGSNITSASLTLSGPNLLHSDLPDIAQVAPVTNGQGGIQSGFVYDAGAGDFLYGTRGSASSPCKIQSTDITGATTLEYSHPINTPVQTITLVDQPAPTTVYDINNINGDQGIYALNQTIIKTSFVWNYELIYIPGGTSGTDIYVYDMSGALVDTLLSVSTVPIRLIQEREGYGDILVIGDDYSSGNSEINLISHTAIGVYSIVNTDTLIGSNQGYDVGTITGREVNTITSSTQYSLTVAGAPWTLNQWNGYRVEIITGAMAGKQVKLWTYLPSNIPPLLNISNDTNTLYIEPGPSDPTFDGTLMVPGDQFTILFEYYNAGGFFDTNASWVTNEWTNYNIVITSGLNRGNFALVGSNGITSLGVKSLCVNEGWKVATGYSVYGLTYGTTYLIYRINDGQVDYDGATDSFIYSSGSGKISEITGPGIYIGDITLQEPNGSSSLTPSYQLTNDGATVYAINRDISNANPSNLLSGISSPHIYRFVPGTGPLPAINGSTRWGFNICGNISTRQNGLGETLLYFTSQTTRQLVEYNVVQDTFIIRTIPAVYEKSSASELIQGAVYLGLPFIGDTRFVIMNRLNNANSPSLITSYVFSNLFVYNWTTDEIEQVLTGAPNKAYSGSYNSWNPESYGEMFAEYMGQKSYGMGGLSISTYQTSTADLKIFWKQSPELQNYVSNMVTETGVAQMWGGSPNYGYTRSLTRIWNIQSDGSLIPSVRNLFVHGGANSRSLVSGMSYFIYDSYYQKVIGTSVGGWRVDVINPNTLTGYYNGPYYGGALDFSSYLSINTYYGTPQQLYYPGQIVSDQAGKIFVNGYITPSTVGQGAVKVYNATSLIGPSNTQILAKDIGDGINPGLYNTAFYPMVYDFTTNKILQMGNATPNVVTVLPPSTTYGDLIIGVFDPLTMNLVGSVNLTTANAVPVGGTGSYYNHFYCPALDKFIYFGQGNNKITFVDLPTLSVTFTGLISTLYNFQRSPVLGFANLGWMVPYGNGFFLDYWTPLVPGIPEYWTYIVPTDVTYLGYTHNIFETFVEGTSISVDDLYAVTSEATTFGQWKVTSSLTWSSIVGSGTINISPNDVIEFTMFSPTIELVSIKNVTQNVTYDPLVYQNTLNSISTFAIKADSIELNNLDELEFTFSNPYNPDCPFINRSIISF